VKDDWAPAQFAQLGFTGWPSSPEKSSRGHQAPTSLHPSPITVRITRPHLLQVRDRIGGPALSPKREQGIGKAALSPKREQGIGKAELSSKRNNFSHDGSPRRVMLPSLSPVYGAFPPKAGFRPALSGLVADARISPLLSLFRSRL
jgi:hypothetical protein